MATFAEVEDLISEYRDVAGKLLSDIVDDLNGEEPADTLKAAVDCANNAHICLLNMIKHLEELLIQKKRVE